MSVVATAQGRTVTGTVVSNKMDKTAVVEVTHRVAHPVYEKVMNRTTTMYAHDEKNECQIGDVVVIKETRPLSKKKRWRLIEILERKEA